MDGTVIKVGCPSKRSKVIAQEYFDDRKGCYCLNTMIICGPRKEILYIDPRWPGSTNDRGSVSRSQYLTNMLLTRF